MGVRFTVLTFGVVALAPLRCGQQRAQAEQLVAEIRERLPASGTVWLRLTTGAQVRTVEWRFDRSDGRSVVRVLAPPEVAGAVITVVDRPGEIDPVGLFLPAYQRETQLAGSMSNRGILRSEIHYGDLEALAFDGELLGVAPTLGGWGVTSVPPAGSPYTKIRSTVRPGDLAPVRAELYARTPYGERRVKVVEVLRTEVHGRWVVPMALRVTGWEGRRTHLEVLALELEAD